MQAFCDLNIKRRSFWILMGLLSFIVFTPVSRAQVVTSYPAATGNNDFEQCEVIGLPNVVAIAAGGYHTVLLRSDKTVAATGDWSYGQCDVAGWINVLQVSAGALHTLGVRANRGVRAVGDNTYLQCAVTGWTNIQAVAAGYWHSVGLHIDGTVVSCGDNRYNQTNVSSWTNIKAIAAGHWHSVGLRKDGTVVCTGDNADGQMNVSSWTNITAIGAGHLHTVGLRTDGTVVATGDNSNGQCNVSGWTNIVAIAVGQWHTVGLKADGTVVATGDTYDGQCQVSGIRHATAIAAGYNHTVVLSNADHYNIYCSAGDNGKIEPEGRFPIASDASVLLTATPSTDYVVDTWTIDDEIVQEGGFTYTLENLSFDAEVKVTFKLKTNEWSITPNCGEHGSIDPSEAQTVLDGSDISFTATPEENYIVDCWMVDDTVQQQGCNSFTLTNVVAGHTVAVSFKLRSWTITPSSGEHGTINPEVAQTVGHGSDISFTATPDDNYIVDCWTVDDTVQQQGGNSFTLTNVVAGHTVAVSFKLRSWTITPSSGEHGTINPEVAQTVGHGSDTSFTASPDDNYIVDCWTVDDTVQQQGGNSFTLTNVVAGHSVAVSFKLRSWSVTPSSGEHGTINPEVAQTVGHGSDTSFTATPDDNYIVDCWTVDDTVQQQGGNSFTLTNVVADHTVAVSFKLRSWSVTPSSGEHGTINPEVAQTVGHGSDISFIATPYDNYLVDSWLLDGKVVREGGESFILTEVIADHALAVTFKLRSWIVTAIAGENGSVDQSGEQTILHGSSVSFTANPQQGYEVDNWLVDGTVMQHGGNDFSVSQVVDNITVSVTFTLPKVSGASLSITPASILQGKQVTLSAFAVGGVDVEYQFFRQVGTEWISLSTDNYIKSPIMLWTSDVVGIEHFRVHVREVGSVEFYAADASVSVLAALSAVSLSANPQSAFIGQQVLLSAVPVGGANVEYQFFFRNGALWTSLNGGKYLADNNCQWLPQNAGSYIVRVNAREVGSSKYFPAECTVRINEPLSGVSLITPTTSVLPGKMVILNALPHGGGYLEYQFFRKEGENWLSLTEGQFVSANNISWLPSAPGDYQFQVQVREVGSVISFTASVMVTVIPPITSLQLAASPSPVLLGNEVVFTAGVSGGMNVEYQFYRRTATGWVSLTDGKYLPSNSYKWLPEEAGKYSIRVIAREVGNTVYFSAVITLTVNPVLSGVSLHSSVTKLLLGKTIVLNATPVGGNVVEYQLYRKEGDVWVSVSGDQFVRENRFEFIASASGNVQFRVDVREAGTETIFSDTVIVTVVMPLSKVTLSALPVQALVGGSVTISAVAVGGIALEYQFYFRTGAIWTSLTGGKYQADNNCRWIPQNAGNYILRVNAREVGTSKYLLAECAVRIIEPLSGVTLITPTTLVLPGKMVLLNAVPNGGGYLEYQFFRKEGENWLSLNEGQYVNANNISWLPSAPGQYQFQVQVREAGSVISFAATVTVTVIPPITLLKLAASPSLVLVGNEVVFTASVSGGMNVEYQFYRRVATGWVSLTGGNYLPSNSCKWVPEEAGKYSIRVNAREVGSTAYFPAVITLTVNPVLSGVNLVAQSSTILIGNSVILDAFPSGGDLVEYQFYRIDEVNSYSLNGEQFVVNKRLIWQPAEVGNYRFKVQVRTVGSTEVFESETLVNVLPLLSSVTLQADPSSARIGSPITLTASAVGGMKLEYQFYRRLATGWESLSGGKYLADNVSLFIPLISGSQLIRVNVHEVGSRSYIPAEVTLFVSE